MSSNDPRIERALEEFFESERLSRRGFIGRAGSSGLALSGLAAVLAACGGVQGEAEKSSKEKQDTRAVSHPKTTIGDWTFSNWPLYIDKKNVPNSANLVDNLKTINYDPKREYTLPWQSGATSIGYNIKKTGRELKSVKDLFDPKFKGKVTMLSEPYDSASAVLLGDGIDASKANIDQLLGAIEKIDQANKKGQFRKFTGNDYAGPLAKGDIWVALAYSGDLVQLQSDNPDLRFAYAEEGCPLFTDNMMMPAKVEHPYAAETMMNYVYEPEVAATIAAYVNYISPVKGVKEVLEKKDPKLAKNPLIFPPEDVAKRLHPYPALSPKDEQTMQEAMAKVTGA